MFEDIVALGVPQTIKLVATVVLSIFINLHLSYTALGEIGFEESFTVIFMLLGGVGLGSAVAGVIAKLEELTSFYMKVSMLSLFLFYLYMGCL